MQESATVNSVEIKERGKPFVSVVIPAHNEESFIGPCLDSLLAQDYPVDIFEILAVDGMSKDNTRNEVEKRIKCRPTVRLLSNPNVYTSFGLNEGVRAARGEIVVILGAHSKVAQNFISENVETLARTGADCVGGLISTIGHTLTAQAIAAAMSSVFGVGNAYFRYGTHEKEVDTVAFGAYRRDVFNRIGLFDEQLLRNQDDEFNYRLRSRGGKIYFSPNIRSSYYSRITIRSLWDQYFNYGFWKVMVLVKHPTQIQLRHLIPSIFILTTLVSLLLCLFAPFGSISCLPLVALGGTYLFVSLLFSIWISIRKRLSAFLIIWGCFPVLHFSYGSGVILGFLKEMTRAANQKYFRKKRKIS